MTVENEAPIEVVEKHQQFTLPLDKLEIAIEVSNINRQLRAIQVQSVQLQEQQKILVEKFNEPFVAQQAENNEEKKEEISI